MSDLTFVSSDDAPSVFGTLAVSGVPLDLTGATVKFQMRETISARYAVDAAAVVLAPAAGTVCYEWSSTDLVGLGGDYVSRWQVTFGDGRVQHSEPENTIRVDPA